MLLECPEHRDESVSAIRTAIANSRKDTAVRKENEEKGLAVPSTAVAGAALWDKLESATARTVFPAPRILCSQKVWPLPDKARDLYSGPSVSQFPVPGDLDDRMSRYVCAKSSSVSQLRIWRYSSPVCCSFWVLEA